MTQIDRIGGLIGSIAVKVPCKAATTANITLSGTQTVDGVALISNDRCLVKDQTIASENGIYDVSGTAWSRATDFNGIRDIAQGTCVRIISGTVSGQYFYEVTTADPLLGNTDIDFALVNFPNTTSSYIATLLDDTTSLEARGTLVAAGTTDNNTFSGTQTFQKTVYWKKGADIISANDLPLATDGNYNDITGTTTINGMTDGIQNEVRKFHFDASLTLKHDTAPTAGFSKLWIPSEADYIASANNEIEFIYDGTYWRMTSLNISNFFRGALVYNTAQSIPDAAGTNMNFGFEEYDTDSIHSTSTNTSRLTVPSGVTKIRLTGSVGWAANTTGARFVKIHKNGSDLYTPRAETGSTSDVTWGGYPQNISSPIFTVVSGDYFEMNVYQNSGAALNTAANFTNWFAMDLIV